MTETKAQTRVAVVEDDPVLRQHFCHVVSSSPGLALAGAGETFQSGLTLLQKPVDVALLDIALPDGSGLDLVRHLRARSAETPKIIIISVFGDVQNVVSAIEAGADGYILKGAEPHEIAAAIADVTAGRSPISPAVAGHILARLRSTPQPGAEPQAALTEKETLVLKDLAKGFSYREVAQIQGISHHTVADHVKAIYRKLSVNSRSEAVFEAVQAGIIRLKD
jgi:DNA-binding NarL/FixJ family response regulator